ncbi:MAG: peptidyl-prolyl cis-trans isomerase [Candidatus Euphemobacter frigidus]|nr:peptidyl-prolyl cis-trans isomerase [Candidatus Euphemobacter frigidus]MDP8276525.1 peptidyl-prolyl cis-trans isomerase [Candidatus Euphemobacter frigidus]
MLKGMRKSAKHILWPLIIALVITMGGYGVWYLVRPEVAASKVGMIWGEEVTLEEFSQTARVARAVAALGGREMTRKELYTITWRRLLLQREAEKMGVTSTRKELARFIARWPVFQVEGRFDPDRYRRILNQLGIDATTFEEQVRNLLAIDRLQMLIRSQTLISQSEVDGAYQQINEKIKVQYVPISKEPYAEPIELSQARLDEYYSQNQARFQVQTQVEIQYIIISRDRFKDSVRLESEEIEARYHERHPAFTDQTEEPPPLEEVEDEIRAELIEEKAQTAATKLAEKINLGLDDDSGLEQPAEEYSLPLETSGYFAADEAVPGIGKVQEINQAAFTMDTDEVVSYPIPIPEGFLLFKLTGKKGASLLPFEEVREEVDQILNDELTYQETVKAAREELAEIRELMEEKELDFGAAAKELELETVTTPFFTREGSDDLPRSTYFVQAAFLTPPDQISDLIPTEDGFAFLTVLKREPAEPMPEEDKERWRGITLQTKAMLISDTWFNNLVRESKFSITYKELQP